MNIISKLPQVGLTIFSEMTCLALQHGAINLSQGFPDFDTHARLKDLVAKYLRAGYNQYAPMQGVGALREAIAENASQYLMFLLFIPMAIILAIRPQGLFGREA